MKKPRVSAIVAMGDNLVIGKGNGLLWHIPGDLPRFKQLTMGHPVIMGRKTFESILAMLGKPLPGRTNIVVTRNPDWSHDDVVPARSFEEALEEAVKLDDEEVFIIGGGQIYAEALPVTNRLYVTRIYDTKDGDTFFPEYEHLFTEVLSDEEHESNGLTYHWITLDRPSATEDLS